MSDRELRLETELLKICEELVKVGITAWAYPSTLDAVKDLTSKYSDMKYRIESLEK